MGANSLIALAVLTAAALVLITVASWRVYRLFGMRIAKVLMPAEIELPYAAKEFCYTTAKQLSKDRPEFFSDPLFTQGEGKCRDLDAIYRRWVFQKVRGLRLQKDAEQEVTQSFKLAARFALGSIACIVTQVSIARQSVRDSTTRRCAVP